MNKIIQLKYSDIQQVLKNPNVTILNQPDTKKIFKFLIKDHILNPYQELSIILPSEIYCINALFIEALCKLIYHKIRNPIRIIFYSANENLNGFTAYIYNKNKIEYYH